MFKIRTTQILFYACVVLFVSGCSGCWTNWQESYRHDEKQPFDLYALYELMNARAEGLVFVKDSLAALQEVEPNTPSNYIFIGSYAYYTERSVTQLLDFVEQGNNAFIAANELPEDLASHLFGNDCYYNFYDDSERIGTLNLDTVTVQLNDEDHDYTLFNIYNYEPHNRATHYLNGGMLCDTLLDNEVLGTLEDYNINFTRLSWGEGSFYFHNNPIFFTNYYLVDSLQHEYAEAVLTVLNEGPIYWDEASRVPPSVARQRNRQANNNQGYRGGRNLLSGNEALSYIQEQPPLALAWYTLLLATLLYVVFRGKRRQRIIPIIHQRENSSKRFIDTISRLVYQKGHHIALAKQELASLRFFLQDRFTVRWKEGEPPPENLAELIGGDEKIANRALAEIRFVLSKKHLTDGELVRFYRAIEPLYKL